MKDYDIVDLYWARDEKAIVESQRKYGGYCHGISMNILNNESDAEECVNDTWVAAWRSMPPKKPSVLRTYLGKLTRNLSINRLRERHREKRNPDLVIALSELAECIPDGDSGADMGESVALRDALGRFVRSLPEKTQEIFLQRYWYSCSVAEIAEGYGMRENSVTVLLHRTRKKLKAHLKKEGFDL